MILFVKIIKKTWIQSFNINFINTTLRKYNIIIIIIYKLLLLCTNWNNWKTWNLFYNFNQLFLLFIFTRIWYIIVLKEIYGFNRNINLRVLFSFTSIAIRDFQIKHFFYAKIVYFSFFILINIHYFLNWKHKYSWYFFMIFIIFS